MSERKKTDGVNGSLSIFTEMELPELPLTPGCILVAPLNWGLGHATRSADVVMRLKKRYPNARMILASDGTAAAWLRLRFPELLLEELPGYRIRYARGALLIPKLMLAAPGILSSIIKEYWVTQKIIRKHHPDLLISDNRYGVWSKRCVSVIITHQLEILSPGWFYRPAFWLLNRINRWWIGHFDQCWVPDFQEPPGLAGDLSHPTQTLHNLRYIGPLTRFRWVNSAPVPARPPKLLCLVSGPEPQRGVFLSLLLQQLGTHQIDTVIVAGTPGDDTPISAPPHVSILPHLPDSELLALIQSCQVVVSRSGFSTIMDLQYTGGKAVFVPTPGQTEQEYLGKLCVVQQTARCIHQQDLDLGEIFH